MGEDPEKNKGQPSGSRVVNLFNMQVAVPQFMEELRRMVGDQAPGYCYECMKCTSGCPAARLQPEFRPHQIIGATRLGFRDQLLDLKAIWNCTTCNHCVETCPQDVAPTDVIRSLRRIAVRSGKILEDHKKVSKLLLDAGHSVPIDEKYKALREELGLPSLPPTVHTHPKALEEVKKIISLTGFKKLISDSE